MRRSGAVRNATSRLARTFGAAVVGLALVACGDGVGPAGTGQMSVTLEESGGSSAIMASMSPTEASASEAQSNSIDLAAVSSVEITLERVEVLPTGRPETEGSAWASLEVDGSVNPVDLMDLAASGPITISSGSVPAGTYTMVRLYFSDATITTNQEIELEGGGTVAAGTYDLFIPSGMETGVKIVLVGFTVLEGEDETLSLEIDSEASIQTVVYNEDEGFIMNSVLLGAAAGIGL